ncbi:hypothetical protein RHSP_82706 [Rhizobium freirei PRF 81]|uniref:Uncharacterized protein n=1 Tax=Rhizobium freirei PRF 81 TaxID=363754 RepID=N6UG24_9HYPH|nr:hypothetical protein [Rhizobium freirei]ENN89108.1 hypothetical protein RHSP_82706 [Rhizobium freirei PRF 81]
MMVKLTANDRTFLRRRNEIGPAWISDCDEKLINRLWLANLIEIVGRTVYISNAGRSALSDSAPTPLQEHKANIGKEEG